MEPESELAFIREAIPDLQKYLLSREVYWPLSSKVRFSNGAHLPQLTIGSLAFSMKCLSVLKLTDDQHSELSGLVDRIKGIRSEWLSNWQLKAGREFNARLHLWQQYMEELRGDVRQHGAFFVREIRARALLQLLRDDGGAISASDQAQLELLDNILRGLTRPGPFIWAMEISTGFPVEAYWFLYVNLHYSSKPERAG